MSENFLTAKIPQALADKLGANGANFAEKLSAFLAENETKLADASKAATETATAGVDLAARLSALETQLGELKKAPALDREDVLKAAKLEASQLVAAAIAKTGGTPLAAATEPAASADANGGRTFEAAMAEHVKQGKSKAEAIRAVIQSEPALYAAWKAKDSSKI